MNALSRVFSAASMNFPKFRDTAWATLPPENVIDSFLDEEGRPRTELSWEKDLLVADAVEGWLEERERAGDERPFLCFVLLDGTHQPYFNPGGPYQPSVERLEYVKLGMATEGPRAEVLGELLENTYKNCVLQADRTAGRLLDSFEQRALLDETVVMVTGDHGEEFGENGFWGHTSNFSPQQVEVPFYLKGPGVETGVDGDADARGVDANISDQEIELRRDTQELHVLCQGVRGQDVFGHVRRESLHEPLAQSILHRPLDHPVHQPKKAAHVEVEFLEVDLCRRDAQIESTRAVGIQDQVQGHHRRIGVDVTFDAIALDLRGKIELESIDSKRGGYEAILRY